MPPYLEKAELIWNNLNPKVFSIFRKVRLCKVGDPFTYLEDIDRVYSWCKANPNTLFLAPTRAWRNPDFRAKLHPSKRPDNLRVMASVDPSNTKDEVDSLVAEGWSTMFFGDDNNHPAKNNHKCPKTWEHKKGECAYCENGCWSDKPVNVWLKKH
jgi:hypothetical protein